MNEIDASNFPLTKRKQKRMNIGRGVTTGMKAKISTLSKRKLSKLNTYARKRA